MGVMGQFVVVRPARPSSRPSGPTFENLAPEGSVTVHEDHLGREPPATTRAALTIVGTVACMSAMCSAVLCARHGVGTSEEGGGGTRSRQVGMSNRPS